MLYGCPVSREAFDATYTAALVTGTKIGFVCSTSQVGPNAYTGFTDDQFLGARREMQKKTGLWLEAERDHLGKNNEDIDEWLARDADHRMDAVHLHKFTFEDIEEHVMKWGSHFRFQVGPGEDDSKRLEEGVIDFASRHDSIDWVSFPMGIKIDCLGNTGQFDPMRIETMIRKGFKIRAHNCDFLALADLLRVAAFCEGINIAPQIGSIQSCFYLSTMVANGFREHDWLDACWTDATNQARWCGGDERLAIQAVGHYHFDKLVHREKFKSAVTDILTQIIGTWANVCSRTND